MNIAEQVHKDIYSFLIKDWKNTSLILDKSNNKAFSKFLNEVIDLSFQKSNNFINYEAIEILNNSTINEKLKNKLTDSLTKIHYEKTSLSSLDFSKKIIKYLSSKYLFINSLRPQGWEIFINNIEKNKEQNINSKINIDDYYSKISMLRKNNFGGFHFNKENNFYDNVSIQLSGYKYFNHNIYPFENLIDSIVKYVFELNSTLYTKDFNDKINLKSDNEACFYDLLNYKETKLNFEKQQDNIKQKEDITKILKNISNN